MNEGIKLLVDRMGTNPEEFISEGKWLNVFNHYKRYMTADEKNAVQDKLNSIKMTEFTGQILKKLMEPEAEQSEVEYEYAWKKAHPPKTVKLNAHDIAMAQKLGVSTQAYASLKAKI